MENVEYSSYGGDILALQFYVENETGQDLLFSVTDHNFSLKDNLGNIFTINCFGAPQNYNVKNGEIVDIHQYCGGGGLEFKGDYYSSNVKQLYFNVKNISRVTEAMWVIDVPH